MTAYNHMGGMAYDAGDDAIPTTAPGTIFHMLRTGKYYPSPTFIMTHGALDIDLTNTLLRVCTKPDTTTMVDVLKIFFGMDNTEAAAYMAAEPGIGPRRALTGADFRADRIRAAMSRGASAFNTGAAAAMRAANLASRNGPSSNGAGPSSRPFGQ